MSTLSEADSAPSTSFSQTLSDPELERLAEKTVSGDQAAAHRLVQLLWPSLRRLVSRTRALRDWSDSDDVVNVMVHLVEKVLSPGSQALASYFSWRLRRPDKTFGDWLRIVTANSARDYARINRSRGRTEFRGTISSSTQVLNEFLRSTDESAVSVRPPYTNKQTANQLLQFAVDYLTEAQLAVLKKWLHGSTFGEIAELLNMPESEAQRLLRSAVARLRRKFS